MALLNILSLPRSHREVFWLWFFKRNHLCNAYFVPSIAGYFASHRVHQSPAEMFLSPFACRENETGEDGGCETEMRSWQVSDVSPPHFSLCFNSVLRQISFFKGLNRATVYTLMSSSQKEKLFFLRFQHSLDCVL